jgi:hypothetical protein
MMLARRIAAAFAGAAVLACSPAVLAQARAGDDTAAPSQLAAVYERFAESLIPRLVGAADAADRWILGRLSPLDPAAQVRDFAAAAARQPNELLYAASLADACMRPMAPVPADCAERDAVGYWASRDRDNAVPWLLQAERARRRNNVASMIDNLEGAARAARYDDYAGRGGAVFASKAVPLAAPDDRAAAVLFSRQQATVPLGAPLEALESVCARATRAIDERITRGCVRLGALMTERAASFSNRRAGAQIALSAATTESARALTNEAARAAVAQQDRCREAFGTLERFAAGSPAERERALSLGQRYLADLAKQGEPGACEALVNSLART